VCVALLQWNIDKGVNIHTHAPVSKLVIKDNRAVGVKTRGVGNIPARVYEADEIIMATGGASYPKTGSNGDGYRLAASIGHAIVPIKAALVPLETVGGMAQKMQGVSLRNVRASVWVDGKKVAEEFGEMLFTHFGLSGPIIISLSRYVVNTGKVKIKVDLKPALDEKKLDARLLRDFAQKSKQQMQTVLKGLLPAKMIPVCLEQTKIDSFKQAHQVNAEERKRLRIFLKNLEFEIKGTRPIAEAIVTSGGVSAKEVNSKTMASKIVENVYFAGEVLDVDGETGGYNLQIAFSTGWLAGQD
jgi:predicted Rossmann fold flavoprotein